MLDGMHFSSTLGIRRCLSPLGVAVWVLACGSHAPTEGPSEAASALAGSAVAVVGNALPERAEAVASADAWAVQGTKLGGRAGAQRLLDAASLRERIFRADHREADALEALELYRQAAREPALRCSAAVAAALLEGELRADPSVSFQGVYRAAH